MKKLQLIAVFLLFTILTACSGTKPPEPPQNSADVTDGTSAAENESGELCIVNSAGKTDYRIIISEQASARVRNAVSDMRSRFASVFNTPIYMKEDTDAERTETEILIGGTDREESKNAISRLEADTYSISVDGKKIVIAATSDEGLESAIKLFTEAYLMSESRLTTLTVKSTVGSVPDIFESLSAGWNDMRQFSYTDHIDLNYRIYKPEGYDSTKKYPILLFLHGNGSRGDDNTYHLESTGGTVVRTITSMPEYKNGVIIIAPQCLKGEQWVDTNPTKGAYTLKSAPSQCLGEAIAVLDYWLEHIPHDENRLYLWGNSMGAFGCWDLMCRYPERFAAAVCVCGCGDLSYAPVLAKNNIWIHHGDSDTTVPYEGNLDMYERLKANGAGDNVKLTTYKGKDHNITGITGKDTALIDWLFSQTRDK
ncbi:MAG: prolyl oligopeptidase family serine peptidase [Clostridia bacterium]|nr:prolyl oligopeptidase family serine peptidase [Clostridia bacterium]